MKNKKTILLSSFVATGMLAFGIYSYSGFNSVSANPDFICVKSVSHGTCDHITRCDNWDTTTHKRTCYGYNITKKGYYHTRTSCEPGYSIAKRGSTSVSTTAARYINSSALYSDWNKWISGRHSKDVTWETSSCTITEVDTKAPVGKETKNYK